MRSSSYSTLGFHGLTALPSEDSHRNDLSKWAPSRGLLPRESGFQYSQVAPAKEVISLRVEAPSPKRKYYMCILCDQTDFSHFGVHSPRRLASHIPDLVIFPPWPLFLSSASVSKDMSPCNRRRSGIFLPSLPDRAFALSSVDALNRFSTTQLNLLDAEQDCLLLPANP